MSPTILDGTMVSVVPRARYLPGDILLVARRGQNRLVTHRLIGCYRRNGRWRYLTQADAADRPDAAVSRDEIIGRVEGDTRTGSTALAPFMTRVWSVLRFFRFVIRKLLSRTDGIRPNVPLR